jgi:hypothetical protein
MVLPLLFLSRRWSCHAGTIVYMALVCLISVLLQQELPSVVEAGAAETPTYIGVEHLYGNNDICRWDYARGSSDPRGGSHVYPEVYWINMDSSPTRRHSMQTHFDKIGFRHFRIRGVAMQDIYIPPGVYILYLVTDIMF